MKYKLMMLVLLLAGIAVPAVAADRPNIVVIYIDDLGYGDTTPFREVKKRPPWVEKHLPKTPHLDKMAEEGMKLTSFYSGSSVCTPSRAALMTGCYPQRIDMETGKGRRYELRPGSPKGLNPDETTMAEMLKEQGYATACFGVWHLGDQPEFMPDKHGFDEFYGIPYSHCFWPLTEPTCYDPKQPKPGVPELPMLRNGKVESIVKNMGDVKEFARIFTEETIGFIRKNKDKPFFVYLPHPFVNSPRIGRQEFYPEGWVPGQEPGKGNGQANARAAIQEVDWSTGQILDTLRELGLDKNTLVIFTSDNGGGHCHVNEPLRGRERGEWEGCHRVATLAWWPGQVPKNSTCDEVLTAMDLLPTFASIAGGKLPNDRVMDGKDISPVLLGKEGAKSPHNTYYYYLVGKLAAVRSGEWKLHKNGVLYNLNTNIKEGGRGQAGKNPEVVARLKKMMADFGAEMKDPAKVRKAAYVEKPQFLTKPAKEK